MFGRRLIATVLLATPLALASCGGSDDGPLGVAFIDTEEQVFSRGLRLSYGGQIVRAATNSGLVTLDAQGEVVPALADRWIVADDGRSYIFRLRDGEWPDGSDLTGESARDSLRRVLRDLHGTSLGLDLAPVREVRAMAGRVVEIRLAQPMPDFLRLLAQPELALSHGGFPSGRMILERESQDSGGAVLTFRPPEARGLPRDDEWQDRVRPIAVSALDPRAALAAFENGEVDIVLGGRLGAWPLADPGPLSRGTRRLDPAIGLFGFLVRHEGGFLGRAENREALAMAIDRPALLAPFNIAGWIPTTRAVPAFLAGEDVSERWEGIEIERLRAEARRRVQAWSAGAGAGEAPVLTVALSDQPGNAALFNELARQWDEIGVALRRAAEGQSPDLVLVDNVARYAGPLWFLNQFNCTLRRGLCSPEADATVREALEAVDFQARADALARAEAMLTAANVYIPLAMPLRWSLVRGNVEGYAANQWAWHPLPDMATIPR